MKHIFSVAIVFAAVVAATPAFAADQQLDGQLPMYPRGALDAKESSLTLAAIAQGVPLVLFTADSVDTVDIWYASHAGKACHRQDASGATKFACPGGSIMVYAKAGKTQIALIPPLPGFK